MLFTLQDRSNYLKGLLILIGKDRIITDAEKNKFLALSKILDFNSEFCENAINELLENENINQAPPVFSNKSVAKAFIIDGLRLSYSDKEYHIKETDWLKKIAEKNSIDVKWYNDQFILSNVNSGKVTEIGFEAEKLMSEFK